MNRKICIFSDNSVGCTFVDWSLYFLSGQTNFYYAPKDMLLPLVDNPIESCNAHKHQKNHPAGLDMTRDYFEKFQNKNFDSNLFSVYSQRVRSSVAMKLLNIKFIDAQNFESILEYQRQDTQNLFDWCNNADIDLVHVTSTNVPPLYFLEARSVGYFLSKNQLASSQEQLDQEFHEIFFKESVKQWYSMGLTNIWDVRERMALDLRPFFLYTLPVGACQPHFKVNCQKIWSNQNFIVDLLDYLKITIDKQRFEVWKTIYRTWQTMQYTQLEFAYKFNDIIAATVNGWFMPIDLNFAQEVAVQHALIYRHGLNLKTWQLNKFPANTQLLHQLLEPNIHSVESIIEIS
jgi:hypothetical protein